MYLYPPLPFSTRKVRMKPCNKSSKLTKFFKKPGKVHLQAFIITLALEYENNRWKVTYRMGVNQSVKVKLPRLPAKKVYASLYRRLYQSDPDRRGRKTHLQGITSREDGNEWHISDGTGRANHPGLEVE